MQLLKEWNWTIREDGVAECVTSEGVIMYSPASLRLALKQVMNGRAYFNTEEAYNEQVSKFSEGLAMLEAHLNKHK